jgi:UDP-N-acetylglucosamine:LPS N-acetylglucosamine transferase
LVVCSIGGTSIGRKLLELCGQAYPIIKNKVPELQMVLVCGPRLSSDSLRVPSGVELKKYVPALYEYFAASDMTIIQAGGTTTLELTALKRPFIYFPLVGHSEQEIILTRLARHQAGIKMMYSNTTPEIFAETIISNLDSNRSYANIPINGAKTAAQLIFQLI